jgi:protein-tyrosine-phosphatase/tRNA A37 threonylcarbamoyladenosine synthetase subunit TsaC/SUA5/YrdC
MTIISWQPDDTSADVITHLLDGRCVALPSESTYEVVCSALNPRALANLPTDQTAAIVLFDFAELFDWMPRLRGAGARLFRKLGPSPVILRASAGHTAGLCPRLPDQARERVAANGLLAVRFPGHPIWNNLRAAGPLVSVPIPGAINAAEAERLVGAKVACVVDGGDAQYADVPTVVRIEGRRAVVERQGVLNQEQIDELACARILFVCTGNTCRSPMAAAFCARMLATHLGCEPAQLPEHGILVQSAGLAAMMESEASREAFVVAAELGSDLSHHRSRMVTMEMLAWADHIFAMTMGHASTLESIHLEGMTLPHMLSRTNEDIVDPIGAEAAAYRTCAHQIMACLQVRLPELLES